MPYATVGRPHSRTRYRKTAVRGLGLVEGPAAQSAGCGAGTVLNPLTGACIPGSMLTIGLPGSTPGSTATAPTTGNVSTLPPIPGMCGPGQFYSPTAGQCVPMPAGPVPPQPQPVPQVQPTPPPATGFWDSLSPLARFGIVAVGAVVVLKGLSSAYAYHPNGCEGCQVCGG